MTTSIAPLPENSHFIPLDKATSMTAKYRENREQVLAPQYQRTDLLPLSETFNRQAFDQLLSTPGCAGVRIYYGMDTGMKIHAVIVAVNGSNEDILPLSSTQNTGESTDDPVVVEEGQRCPPICPEKSPLTT